MANLKSIIVILVFAAIIFSGCSISESEDYQISENSFESESQNLLRALVNGEEISRSMVMQTRLDFEAQGRMISEDEALEHLIYERLLLQEVADANISVSFEDAESFVSSQLMMYGISIDDYRNEIMSSGISYEEEIEVLRGQLAVQEFLDMKFADLDLNVSSDDAREFYDFYSMQYGAEGLPSFEEVEEEIILTLEAELREELTSEFVLSLREGAEIIYY